MGTSDVIFPSPPPKSHWEDWSLRDVVHTSLWKCLKRNVGDRQPFWSKILSETFAWSFISHLACVLPCIGWIRARSTALSRLVALRGTSGARFERAVRLIVLRNLTEPFVCVRVFFFSLSFFHSHESVCHGHVAPTYSWNWWLTLESCLRGTDVRSMFCNDTAVNIPSIASFPILKVLFFTSLFWC